MKHADFEKTFIINFKHEKIDNKMYCVVCIVFGIPNKNYVKRPGSNSYLGQQSLSWRTSSYVTGPRLVRGVGKTMFPYFR